MGSPLGKVAVWPVDETGIIALLFYMNADKYCC